jgi:alkylation response protein AidB-like acyl-CoA dehydrogenase
VDFTRSEEQAAAAELAATLFATAEPAERGLSGFDTALWGRLAGADLLGIGTSAKLGGSGLGLAEASAIAEECGRAAARVPIVPVLAALGTLADLGDQHSTDLLTGQAIMVPALAETGAGDPRRPGLAARRTEDGWKLHGTRTAIPWARQATQLLTAARTEAGELLLALLDTQANGITLDDEQVSSGEPHATAVLDGALVTEADVLSHDASTVEGALTRSTLLTCAHALGLAEAALHMAATHVSGREQFGRPLATFQSVTAQLADRWIDVESMRLTQQQATWRFDEDLPTAEETAVAALWGAEGVHRVTETAVHLHGGLGVDVSYPLHRYFLAAKVDELSLGGAGRGLERLGALLAGG